MRSARADGSGGPASDARKRRRVTTADEVVQAAQEGDAALAVRIVESQGTTLGESEQVKDDLTRVLREAGFDSDGDDWNDLAVWARPLEGRWRRCRRTSRR